LTEIQTRRLASGQPAGLFVPRLAALLAALCLAASACQPISDEPTPAPTPVPHTLPAPTEPPAATPAAPPESPPAATTAPPTPTAWPAPGTWQHIDPGGDTVCLRGTSFSFWARQADPARLLIYFQGGGACWDFGTCSPGSGIVKEFVAASDHPRFLRGIFDDDHPDNPFAGWSMIFVPYCSGDLHWGNHPQTYDSGRHRLEVQHRGFANSAAALDWAEARFHTAEAVFVAGCSAGSVGSAAQAPYVIERFGPASFAQLGDSFSFVHPRPGELPPGFHDHDNLPGWIPALQAMPPEDFNLTDYYAAVAGHYSQHTFAQFNFYADRVQQQFFAGLGGPPGGFSAYLAASLAEIEQRAANFRHFTAPGSEHCVLQLDRFYSLAVEGVSLRDWVAELAAGGRPASVACAGCAAQP
jgi:hypothetical protein